MEKLFVRASLLVFGALTVQFPQGAATGMGCTTMLMACPNYSSLVQGLQTVVPTPHPDKLEETCTQNQRGLECLTGPQVRKACSKNMLAQWNAILQSITYQCKVKQDYLAGRTCWVKNNLQNNLRLCFHQNRPAITESYCKGMPKFINCAMEKMQQIAECGDRETGILKAMLDISYRVNGAEFSPPCSNQEITTSTSPTTTMTSTPKPTTPQDTTTTSTPTMPSTRTSTTTTTTPKPTTTQDTTTTSTPIMPTTRTSTTTTITPKPPITQDTKTISGPTRPTTIWDSTRGTSKGLRLLTTQPKVMTSNLSEKEKTSGNTKVVSNPSSSSGHAGTVRASTGGANRLVPSYFLFWGVVSMSVAILILKIDC